MWCINWFFEARKTDYSIEKENFPENTLMYFNQAYLTIKKNKKVFYCDYFMLYQVIEVPALFQHMST